MPFSAIYLLFTLLIVVGIFIITFHRRGLKILSLLGLVGLIAIFVVFLAIGLNNM